MLLAPHYGAHGAAHGNHVGAGSCGHAGLLGGCGLLAGYAHGRVCGVCGGCGGAGGSTASEQAHVLRQGYMGAAGNGPGAGGSASMYGNGCPYGGGELGGAFGRDLGGAGVLGGGLGEYASSGGLPLDALGLLDLQLELQLELQSHLEMRQANSLAHSFVQQANLPRPAGSCIPGVGATALGVPIGLPTAQLLQPRAMAGGAQFRLEQAPVHGHPMPCPILRPGL
ncbi:hypothetical protein T492DRAFT_1092544 [Pavlovales sp. CCMP2436]|nr:hypothetical protein T492DRAFT_1092544 [Pavlovales sp. CCMP2436]